MACRALSVPQTFRRAIHVHGEGSERPETVVRASLGPGGCHDDMAQSSGVIPHITALGSWISAYVRLRSEKPDLRALALRKGPQKPQCQATGYLARESTSISRRIVVSGCSIGAWTNTSLFV